jgi:hypothetical protein
MPKMQACHAAGVPQQAIARRGPMRANPCMQDKTGQPKHRRVLMYNQKMIRRGARFELTNV